MNKFAQKKVAVLGLGINGVDSAKYLLRQGAQVTILDQKPESQLKSWLDQLSGLNIKFICGPQYLDHLQNFDVIFRSPGIKLNLSQLIDAQQSGVVITSPTIEFFAQCKSKIIGVTGTKGKGTTSTLIYNIMKESGLNVFLAGNIGIPMLELLDKLNLSDWVVLELSSFQLQDLSSNPHIAVITNITQDHLDYHQSREEYINAKLNILKYQSSSDHAVLNLDDSTTNSSSHITQAKVHYFSITQPVEHGCFSLNNEISLTEGDFSVSIGSPSDLRLRGPHNLSNVTAAITASYLAGANLVSIKQAVFAFTGLEHRLELVKEVNGIQYYNDSFGTTPETAIAALNSFTEPIILIAGGSEKGSDYTQLGQEIIKHKVKAVILIGLMSDRMQEAINQAGGFKGQIITGLTNMPDIVKGAARLAAKGDIVLLSPACASFDMFKNYKDRGNQFKSEVNKL